MITFPNAKINLGLHIINKRPDGYHNLETVFYPVQLRDALEIIPSTNLQFQSTGLPISGEPENNLCVKAYNLLKNDFLQITPVEIFLHKAIPMGAGLGGGSSDASFLLKILNEKFRLGISNEKLINYALQLGSDCPFFITNKPSLATGRGEVLSDISVNVEDFTIVIVSPSIHVNTGKAFSLIKPTPGFRSVSEIVMQPVDTWKYDLHNEFEEAVFPAHPFIAEIKKTLYESKAVYAAMTGSGSSVFGLFKQKPTLPTFTGAQTFVLEQSSV